MFSFCRLLLAPGLVLGTALIFIKYNQALVLLESTGQNFFSPKTDERNFLVKGLWSDWLKMEFSGFLTFSRACRSAT
jgi:hypothetical protein